ncbi:hypothetical protein [Photobacterium leiognathi]|uniref:hypothetical protein n=1 Tax=Photobacterium leiognathi TaxID=553611 RepID=UPI002980B566|nr:hypothetical protein [Photobacterium leiognathi]
MTNVKFEKILSALDKLNYRGESLSFVELAIESETNKQREKLQSNFKKLTLVLTILLLVSLSLSFSDLVLTDATTNERFKTILTGVYIMLVVLSATFSILVKKLPLLHRPETERLLLIKDLLIQKDQLANNLKPHKT